MTQPARGVSEQFSLIWQDFKIPLILGSLSLFCIFTAVVLLVKSTQISTPIEFSNVLSDSTTSAQLITVDIEGGVAAPGVYKLPYGSYIDDAIKLAGGLSESADSEKIAKSLNRAGRVGDGTKIYIPTVEENDSSHNQSYATSGDEPEPQLVSDGSSGVAGAGTVSINNASQSELELLNGIGPATATKIISNRPYDSVDDLLNRKVIGQSLYNKLKDQFSL